jgi:hypothetical protein
VPVRGDLGPVRRISPALRQNFIRSSLNHQLEAGVGGKNLSLECWRATLLPALSQVSWRVAGTNGPFGMIIRGGGADARLPGRPARRGPGHGAGRDAARRARRAGDGTPGTARRGRHAEDGTQGTASLA